MSVKVLDKPASVVHTTSMEINAAYERALRDYADAKTPKQRDRAQARVLRLRSKVQG